VKALRLVFLAFLPFTVVEVGSACSCAPSSVQERMRLSEIVFRGELVAHRSGSAVFHVREYWKGNLENSVELEWRRGDRGDCNGFWPEDLKVGNDLLVFATRSRDGIYRTSICLPTTPFVSANKILQELGPGEIPGNANRELSAGDSAYLKLTRYRARADTAWRRWLRRIS